jgi:TRAP-type C4-dicarboxylate transport system permease small subunit
MNIIRITDKVLDGINALMEFVMGLLMLALVGVTTVEVIRRYVFNDPTHWASELCRFFLIWMTFTGAGIVTRLVTHLTMGFTIHRFVSPKIGKYIKVFVAALTAFVMIVITYYSTKVVMLAGYRRAPMTGMPMYYPWSSLPINAALMSLYMIAETIKHLIGKTEGVPE